MQLTATYRVEAVSKQCSFVHLLGLVGTQIKEKTEVGHSLRPMGKQKMIHFGCDGGKHTNKSAGCAVCYRAPFQPKHVHCISPPSKASGLRGRAGAVTFFDVETYGLR